MKKYCSILLLFIFYSCTTLKIAGNKNAGNTKDIGMAWSYSDKVNQELQGKIDDAIASIIQRFNAEEHAFDVHKKEQTDKDYLTIDFAKGKIVGPGEKAAGYIVSALGLIVVPAVLIGADAGFIVAFYFLPTHKIDGVMSLSSNLAADKGSKRRLLVEAGALFSKTSKKVDRLIVKFSDNLYASLVKMDEQISSN